MYIAFGRFALPLRVRVRGDRVSLKVTVAVRVFNDKLGVRDRGTCVALWYSMTN